jgi:hypothetical protein
MAERIALIGKARSGKDTVAEHLVKNHGFTRFAFADPLKEMALRLNPWVDIAVPGEAEPRFARLADLISAWGWERAKDSVPEVRRILQEYGQGVREQQAEFWIEALLLRAIQVRTPIVVSDCRYINEAVMLARAGFTLVRIDRPAAGLEGDAGAHSSETEQEEIKAHSTILNDADVPALLAKATRWLTPPGLPAKAA